MGDLVGKTITGAEIKIKYPMEENAEPTNNRLKCSVTYEGLKGWS